MKKLIACLILTVIFLGGTAQAATGDYLIQGVVQDRGQGSQLNVSADQTQDFENRYGDHDPRDQIMSDLTLYLVEALFALVVLLAIFETKRDKSPNI